MTIVLRTRLRQAASVFMLALSVCSTIWSLLMLTNATVKGGSPEAALLIAAIGFFCLLVSLAIFACGITLRRSIVSGVRRSSPKIGRAA